MRIRLYLDENIHLALAEALRKRGFNVLHTQEVGRKSSPNEDQLSYSIKEKRTILTYNQGHYVQLHTEYLKSGREHYGIVVSNQLPIGVILHRLQNLLYSLTADDMINRLEYLSTWR